MALTVHLLDDEEPLWLDEFRALLGDDINLTAGSELPPAPDFEILVAGVPSESHLTASPRLQKLIIPWTGLPVATRALLQAHPRLEVYNIHHNAIPTAELAITLMMAAGKNLLPIDRSLRRGDWRPRYAPASATLFHGQTAVVLGLGPIGKHVAGICAVLGMKVIGVRRSKSNEPLPGVEIRTGDDLETPLSVANVLHCCLPLTPETEGILGADELACLPDGAIVVNISRGKIIDEAALFAELASGRLRAGLDVWYNYPREEADREHTPPSSYEFASLDTVVMTPHLAGHTVQTENLRRRALAELLNLAALGKPLPNRVDVERGY